MKKFGAYVHIPFCIQRCHYCDFATFGKDQIQANDEYIDVLCREIEMRQNLFISDSLDTLYFGGGTPSLLSPEQLNRIVKSFQKAGKKITDKTEVTIEVNPATLDADKCLALKEIGFNRVSIGCQSFNDDFLKACNREHSADQTRETIELVNSQFDNFSLDLLFALPHQSLSQLENDLMEIKSFQPPHVSAYCLTLPEHHPMNKGRGSEEEQVEMFERVLHSFSEVGLTRYELSNFCKPGFESQHNNLYWTDQNFWGVGLSAHSYRKSPNYGYRFWNTKSYDTYFKQMNQLDVSSSIENSFPSEQWEKLKFHESLTDFCHTGLRLTQGLALQSVRQKFGNLAAQMVVEKLQGPIASDLVELRKDRLILTEKGFLLSNRVFEALLILPEDIDRPQSNPIF